ncbi:hypothetical protein [Dactylosporangium sp. CA-139066]|uniref:hypothetical protein n=1 Tax=Dactylosporangium sp. CA-139066 TaxID=3239930 RepID=UPI003D8DA5E5
MTDTPGRTDGPSAGDGSAAGTGADEQAERVAAVLRQELQAAGRAARESGTDPEEITADLTERLARLRRLNAADSARDPNDPPG